MDAVEVNTTSEPENEEDDDMSHQDVDICRVCLLGNLMMRGLFHQDSQTRITLSQKVMDLASVKVTPGDGLPSQICCDCCDKLETAYKFKLQVEQADTLLRERLDSLNMKEALFFSDVVNLTHRNDVGEISDVSLLLKDHMDSLNVQKLSEGEDDKNEIEEQNQQFTQGEVQKEQQIQIEGVSEHQNQFGTQELQDLMLNEMSEQERIQNELNHTLHEHNYVAEPQHTTDNSNTLVSENGETKDGSDKDLSEEQIGILEQHQESSSNKQQTEYKEENYFENLNLSSRLKQVQSEKVYFMCYLCEKQFLSKEVLKEHMHSHEEVRKTLTQKTPEKSQNQVISSSPSNSKTPSSGKHPNTCPHCGKEYLYIISFNKHLKQHEREKSKNKDGSMPLEVSFQEGDDDMDFEAYDDNPTVGLDSDDEDVKQEKIETDIDGEPESQTIYMCNICDEEFNTVEKLKAHRSKHVAEGVITQRDLENDLNEQISNTVIKNENETVVEEIRKEDNEDLRCPHCPIICTSKKSLTQHVESSHRDVKYTCKLCHQSFLRKDQLRRHSEQHSNRMKSFKCSQCNKTFGNELTLRNHLIATNHKTIVQGQEYDPNKRIKRVAAKAAQKIIDQIKSFDDSDDEERVGEREDGCEDIKEEPNFSAEESIERPAPRRLQRNLKNLSCTMCDFKFASKQALARHMELHVKDENTTKQESMKKEEHDEEIEEDDDDYEGGLDWPMDSHECPTCKKKYSTKKSLLRHQLLHEEPNFECDICSVKFYRKDKLKAHYDKCSEKNPDQVRKCNICGDVFENNDILKEHRAKHVMEGILTEEDLQEIEPKPEDKNNEKAPRKRRTDVVGLECTECNKRYTSRKGLLRHIKVHEGKKHLCHICSKKFSRHEHLKIHLAKHNMIKPYKCPKCTKRFFKEEQLNNHVSKHEKTNKKVKESSDGSKRFLCEICSKSFTQSTTLIAHLRAHNGIKPYICEVCSRPFTTNAYLKMHMRTHTQERPYICQYCSRAFARADTLANHLTSHTGEAKYHCKYCPKHFRRLKSLKEHVFIHTGQRPYACPTCDRRFNNNGSRYAHSKRCKQNILQGRQPQVTNLTEQQEQQQQTEEQELQLQEELQTQRIQIKPQNIKTITIARPDGGLTQQHVMTHQEILMPLILPLTVTLADVGEEVILADGAKIFTT